MTTYIEGTTPYSWPWNGDLGAEATAVVIVTPADGIPTLDPSLVKTTVSAVCEVANAVARCGGTVFQVVTQAPTQRPFAETPWIADTPRNSSATWFSDLIIDETLTAGGVDAFFDSSLESALRRRGIERIILTGVGLETSAHSTMRSANDRGYECLLLPDACLAYESHMVPFALSMVEMSGGIFGAIGSSDAVVHAFRSRERIFV